MRGRPLRMAGTLGAQFLSYGGKQLKYLIRGLKPVVYILIVELIIYLLFFRSIEVAAYALLWAAIIIGALLLKLTNAGPVDNPLCVMHARQYANLYMIKNLFPSKTQRSEVTTLDNIFEIICYLLVIIVNCVIVYVYG